MQSYALLFIFTAHCAHGLSIHKRGTINETIAPHAASLATASVDHGILYPKEEMVLVRPHAGGAPEHVKFGLRAMNFYGTNLKEHTWSLDMVMIVKWQDPRVIELIPAGLEKVTMAWDQAKDRVWMPWMMVTNRDIEKYEIVSASVTIYRSGMVRRIERANARVMKKFELRDYPFDVQDLNINIASSKYMSDEVVLDPEEGGSGVEEDIWGLYDQQAWNAKSILVNYGEIEQSRGVLTITVKRTLMKYFQDHLTPAFMCLMISWAVFYFPFANPFITARLALSILALLTFTNLMVKSGKELPGAAPFNWNDLFNQQIQTLMFITIVLNISSEICFHTLGKDKIAKSMNNEAKILMPILSVINCAIILGCGRNHWMQIPAATTVTKWTVGLSMLCYCGYTAYQVYDSMLEDYKLDDQIMQEQQDEGEAENEQGEEAGDAGDADAGC